MPTVTVYTAEHMKTIEDKSIVAGQVIGDNLILTAHDGSQSNAGNVRGPKGTNGAAGYTSIVVCSSTSRPTGAARFNGLAIFETDTNKFLIWNGIRWDPPWNQPWGLLAMIQRTVDAGPVGTTEAIIANMSITYTMIANRRIKATWEGNTSSAAGSAANNISRIRVTDNGNPLCVGHSWNLAPDYWASLQCQAFFTPTAGVHTYDSRLMMFGGGSVWGIGRPESPMSLVLEDIGPNGNPA